MRRSLKRSVRTFSRPTLLPQVQFQPLPRRCHYSPGPVYVRFSTGGSQKGSGGGRRGKILGYEPWKVGVGALGLGGVYYVYQ